MKRGNVCPLGQMYHKYPGRYFICKTASMEMTVRHSGCYDSASMGLWNLFPQLGHFLIINIHVCKE
jgi:hypothetical protein